ncbi:MAG: TraR/DksA family transcriptional regulator [Holophagales bacterium]|nr:TraR/DksA family transcriptional regulator [Holophagales bacterium]
MPRGPGRTRSRSTAVVSSCDRKSSSATSRATARSPTKRWTSRRRTWSTAPPPPTRASSLSPSPEADRKALLLIEQALLRIDQGTYGVCVHCQGVVQDKRLEAVPWARHCLECQEMQDKGLL